MSIAGTKMRIGRSRAGELFVPPWASNPPSGSLSTSDFRKESPGLVPTWRQNQTERNRTQKASDCIR